MLIFFSGGGSLLKNLTPNLRSMTRGPCSTTLTWAYLALLYFRKRCPLNPNEPWQILTPYHSYEHNAVLSIQFCNTEFTQPVDVFIINVINMALLFRRKLLKNSSLYSHVLIACKVWFLVFNPILKSTWWIQTTWNICILGATAGIYVFSFRAEAFW
jgi:hypothetical protein